MSYYFVDGNRNGFPAQALYVAADSPKAAQARARELGLEPTGVRPAKSLLSKLTPKQFLTFCYTGLAFAWLFMFMERFGPDSFKAPNSMSTIMVFLILPHAVAQVAQLMRDRDSMEAQIQELRQRLTSLEETSRLRPATSPESLASAHSP